MRVNVKDVRLILYSPIDLNGIPVPNYNNNRAIWLHLIFSLWIIGKCSKHFIP